MPYNKGLHKGYNPSPTRSTIAWNKYLEPFPKNQEEKQRNGLSTYPRLTNEEGMDENPQLFLPSGKLSLQMDWPCKLVEGLNYHIKYLMHQDNNQER